MSVLFWLCIFRDQSCSANTLEQVNKQFEISLTGLFCKDLWCYQLISLVEPQRNNFVVWGEIRHQIIKASEIISCADPDVCILAGSTWPSLFKNCTFWLQSGMCFWSWTPSCLQLQCIGSHHRTVLENMSWIPFRWFQKTVGCTPSSNAHSIHRVILNLVLRSSMPVVLFYKSALTGPQCSLMPTHPT